MKNSGWAFCKIIRHVDVEVEVSIALPWIPTLPPSSKPTVSALRLWESQISGVAIAAIGPSSVGSIGFDILDEGLCFTGCCAIPPWRWNWSEANEAVQASMSRNSSSDRAWSIFSSRRGVFLSASDERLWWFPKDSMDGRQRSPSLLVSRSPPPRLFPAVSEISASVR